MLERLLSCIYLWQQFIYQCWLLIYQSWNIYVNYLKFDQIGRELVGKNHAESSEISDRVEDIEAKWRRLLEATSNRGKGLEEARDILRFNEEVEIAETWIREKVCIINICICISLNFVQIIHI